MIFVGISYNQRFQGRDFFNGRLDLQGPPMTFKEISPNVPRPFFEVRQTFPYAKSPRTYLNSWEISPGIALFETHSSHLKMDAWKTTHSFPSGILPIFRGENVSFSEGKFVTGDLQISE